MPPPAPSRLESSSPELDAAELNWWREFSEVEERFCWVQTPGIQRLLRGRYLRRILKLCPPNARVAELGCGTGWLTILLARMGAGRVVGMDFSPEQILKARRNAREAGVADKASFLLMDSAGWPRPPAAFDVVIMHGFLHHLSSAEIREMLAAASGLLDPGGSLLLLEPVCYHSSVLTAKAKLLLAAAGWLAAVPLLGQDWGLRKIRAEERSFRTLIARRWTETPPRGPSPKEMPFAPDELDALLRPYFRVEKRWRCIGFSHWVAQEILLSKLSHPRAAAILQWPLLLLAKLVDSLILGLKSPPPELWIFEMFECRPA